MTAQQVLKEEPNLVRLKTPISICGDIHGQFDDLRNLFWYGGAIEHTRYLFLGDYVDRGYNSVDTLALLLAYKVKLDMLILFVDFVSQANHSAAW